MSDSELIHLPDQWQTVMAAVGSRALQQHVSPARLNRMHSAPRTAVRSKTSSTLGQALFQISLYVVTVL